MNNSDKMRSKLERQLERAYLARLAASLAAQAPTPRVVVGAARKSPLRPYWKARRAGYMVGDKFYFPKDIKG